MTLENRKINDKNENSLSHQHFQYISNIFQFSIRDNLTFCDSVVVAINLLDDDQNLIGYFSKKRRYELWNSQEVSYVVNQHLFHTEYINLFHFSRPIPNLMNLSYSSTNMNQLRIQSSFFFVVQPDHIVNIVFYFLLVPDWVNLTNSCLALLFSVLNYLRENGPSWRITFCHVQDEQHPNI